jgi:hypothetical protein
MQAFLVKKKEKTHLWRACAYGDEIPTQAEAVTGATSTVQAEYKSLPDLDYLQVMSAASLNSWPGSWTSAAMAPCFILFDIVF